MNGFLKRLAVIFFSAAVMLSAFPAVVFAETEYDQASAVNITFSEDSATASLDSTDIEIDGTAVTISGQGTYVFSGECSDGSIKVKKGTEGVTLVLNGLKLASKTSAPMVCGKSTKVTILAASGSENILSDTELNNDDNNPENENAENAVIKCKDGSQVKLCGKGSLTVNSNGKNGIKSGASTDEEGDALLEISDITLKLTASVNDAVNAEAEINIISGNITVSAADDGIHCDYLMNIGQKGTEGPTITVEKSYEGLEAATLNIYSGNINITAEDDGINAANSDLTDYAFSIDISGGSIYVYSSAGDGLDSNGTLTVSGGELQAWTASTADDQPLDADGTITVSGGTVLAAGGSAGMGMKTSAEQPYIISSSSAFGGGFGGGRGNAEPPEMPEGNASFKPDERPEGEMEKPNNMPKDNQSGIKISSGSKLGIASGTTTLFSAEAPCDVSFVFFSSEKLKENESYTLLSGTESVAALTAQTGQGSAPDMPLQNNQSEGGVITVRDVVIILVLYTLFLALLAGAVTAAVIFYKKRKANSIPE